MALNVPGSSENFTPETNTDTFSAVSEVTSSSPSMIEPMVQRFENAGTDTAMIDRSGEIDYQKDITNLSLTMRDNFNQPMDQAAKLLKLEMDTGLPSQYIKDNMVEVEKQAHIQNFSVENFRETNPKFAKWVAENPNHYSFVKDDLDKFRDLEVAGQGSFMSGLSNAQLQAEKSQIIGKRIRDEQTPADIKREAEIDQLMQSLSEKSENESGAQMLARTGGYATYQLGNSIGAATVGAGVGAVLAPFTAGLSIPAGAKIGAMAANTLAAYEMETNFAYDELTKMGDQSGNKLDKETALNVARGIGAINAAIETAGDIIFLKMIPGGEALLGSATKSARKSMTELAAKALTKPGMTKVLGESAKMMLKGSSSEAATEFIQSLVGATGTRAAIAVDGKINPETSWGDDLSQGALEAKEAFFGSIFTLGIMHGTANSYNHIKRIKNGEENARFFEAVAGGVQSKSFQSLPEKGQEAVRAAIAGGANETTYFQTDGWNEYWQKKGIDPREAAAQVVGDGGKAYDQAFDTGGFIKVPTDQMGRKLLANGEHTDLMLDATTDPSKETAREAMKAREELQAEIDAAKEGTQKTEANTNQVEQKIYEQLKKANDPGDAKKKAKLFATINENLAKEAGLTPDEFFDKHGLKISRIMPERLMEKNINEIDPLIERLRSGDIPTETQARGKSLTEFLREKGGINLVGQGSDIASFEADKSMKGFKRLSNKKSGMDVDRAAILAHEAGYITEADTRELIDAVSKDVSGEYVFSSQNEDSNLSETRQLLNEFKKHLDSLGVDLTTQDNATIKKMLAENRANPQASEMTFFQKGKNKQKISDDYFENPKGKGDVILPNLNKDDLKLIGAKDKPVIIKENIAVKNHDSHTEILNDKEVISSALYEATHIIQSKPGKKPKYRTFVKKIIGSSNLVLIEINEGKDNYEVVNWYKVEESAFDRIVKRAEREGGQVLITERSKSQGAAALSALTSSVDSVAQVNGEVKEGKSYNQSSSLHQGRIRISPNRTMNIDLYATANFSTFLHEQGHYWLEVMGDIAESPTGSQRIKEMYAETLKYLGIENRSQIETKHHEMFAESFEKYLMEGKAPTTKLQDMFNTFKAWMTWVYTSLKGLQVELSPEIRNVFDRMIASDEEIARSKQEQSMNPLILDPVMAGMSEEEAVKYAELQKEANDYASQELTVKMMKQLQRERSSAWKAERKEVKEQVTRDVDGQFDQILIKALKTGEMPSAGLTGLKLNKKFIIEAYGKEFADKLPRSIFNKDGYDHNTLASMLGFDNGWQMIELIANAQDRNALIEQKTNDEMLARHGDEDIYINGKLHDEALKLVHNDKRAELMRMEMDWLMQNRTKDAKGLIKSVGRRVPTVKQARLKAESLINEMVVSSIKPYQFLRAEKKHANDALNYMLKGDFENAFNSKKKELLNHELYRAAENAKEEIDKAEGRFNKFFQEDSKIAKTRDMDIVGAGRAILSGFGFSNDPRSPEQHLEKMKRYDPEGYEFLKGRISAALENADYYENLTFEKYQALDDLVTGLWNQAKSERMIEIDGKKIDIQIAMDSLNAGLSKLESVQKKKDKYERTSTDDDNNLNFFQTIRSRVTRMEFKIDSMDSVKDVGGVFRTYIYNPIRQATELYRTKKGELTIKMNEIVKANEANFGGQEIIAEGLGFAFKNKGELLGAMLHIGNESNFKKLILGNEWGTKREDGSLDSSRWDSFIKELQDNGTLTKADYDFLQSIWDLLDSIKGDTQRAHKEMNGFYFNEITAKEIDTPFGKFRGGYVPATADKLRSRDPQIRNEKAMIEDNFHSELPQKLDGFSKSREENYSTPLVMDIGLITSHIDNALRYTYITPRVKEVMKLVHNREMREKFDNYDPTFVSHVVIPFLQRATTQSTTVATQNKHADKFFSFARNNKAIQLMFANIPNTVQQVANYIPAAMKANPIYLLNAVKESTLHSKDIERSIMAKSPFMNNLIDNLSEKAAIETQNIIQDKGKIERGSVWLAKNAYVAQIYLQNIMNKHVWLASYDQAIADGKDEGQAVNYADAAVRSTQGSFAAEDTAAIETNTPIMKSLMMFFGFFNNMGNLYSSEWNQAGSLETGKREIKRSMIIANYFLFAFAGKLAIDAVRGNIKKDDEDDLASLEFWMKYFFGASFELAAPMAGVPGQLAYMGFKNLVGESSYNDRISVSPILSSAEQLAKGVKNIVKEGGSQKTMTKDVMTLMADIPLMGFIPIKGMAALQKGAGYSAAIGALKRPVGYAVGVQEGKDSAENPMDVVQGLVSGASKK